MFFWTCMTFFFCGTQKNIFLRMFQLFLFIQWISMGSKTTLGPLIFIQVCIMTWGWVNLNHKILIYNYPFKVLCEDLSFLTLWIHMWKIPTALWLFLYCKFSSIIHCLIIVWCVWGRHHSHNTYHVCFRRKSTSSKCPEVDQVWLKFIVNSIERLEP